MNFTGGRILYDDSPDWDMGSGDFVCRFWFKLSTSGGSGNRVVFCGQADAAQTNLAWNVLKNPAGRLFGSFYHSGGVVQVQSTTNLAANIWYFAEFSRVGNKLYASVDGAGFGVVDISGLTMLSAASKFSVGGWGEYTGGGFGGSSGDRIAGLVADFEVYKGVGGNIVPFTPPTAELPTT